MEETLANKREEQEQIGYDMLREGGHSIKEIAEAMGVTSLHEVRDTIPHRVCRAGACDLPCRGYGRAGKDYPDLGPQYGAE